MEKRTKSLIINLLCPLLVLAALVWIADRQLVAPDFTLRLSFYDVGQGDAALVRTYEGNKVLIDGGPSDAVLSRLGQDLPFYDRTLDAVILTHPHSDHLSGLVDVLKRYRVKRVLMAEYPGTVSAEYLAFLELAHSQSVDLIYLRAGERVWLDSATVFDVLSPEGKVAGAITDQSSSEGKGVNDGSLVGRLSFGKTRVLFEGDAGLGVESLIDRRFDLQSDVLKVGHHGSSSATSPEFLAKVNPSFAVIEVGEKNRYGHPADEVLQNLRSAGVDILRTDQDGTIRFVSDGQLLRRDR